MDSEDYRTGSADSENGSDNSYVQVSKEDAQHEPLDSGPSNDSPELVSGTAEDYTLEEGESATTKPEAMQVSLSAKPSHPASLQATPPAKLVRDSTVYCSL